MISKAQTSHIGSCLSVCEITAVLQEITCTTKDIFIFSKGHAAAAAYAALAGTKVIPEEYLDEFCADGSELIGHVNHAVAGINFSSGSLGHGLPFGIGIALSNRDANIYVLVSDGELNEGTTWESLAIAAQLELRNITIVVDVNGIQSFGRTDEVLNLEPLNKKFENFGWDCQTVDGHSIPLLYESILNTSVGKPRVVLAQTVKGKGIEVMENKLKWHYQSPGNKEVLDFIKEVDTNA